MCGINYLKIEQIHGYIPIHGRIKSHDKTKITSLP